jgi:RNA polymerase sigma-70 factor (ECF subfamily)
VERFFNHVRQFRHIATWYEKLSQTLLAFIHLMAPWILLKECVNTPSFQERADTHPLGGAWYTSGGRETHRGSFPWHTHTVWWQTRHRAFLVSHASGAGQAPVVHRGHEEDDLTATERVDAQARARPARWRRPQALPLRVSLSWEEPPMDELSSEGWLRALRAPGAAQEQALATLRRGLLRALQWHLTTQRSAWRLAPEQARTLAEDLVQDALLLILAKLDTFRGESHFTTWAYAVALRHALGELRRQRWLEHAAEARAARPPLPIWPLEDQRARSPEQAAQQAEIWHTISTIMARDLTVRQRTVLVGHVFQGVPLDRVAEELGTNRDNVYKLLHDARKKLKQRLLQQGFTYAEILKAFEAT